MCINVNDFYFSHIILGILPFGIEYNLIYVSLHLFEVDRSLDILHNYKVFFFKLLCYHYDQFYELFRDFVLLFKNNLLRGI